MINVKTLWETWQALSVFSDLPPHEILSKSIEKKKNKGGGHRKAKQKLQQRDVESVGVEKNFFFSSVFLCSQPIRSVAKLTACFGHMASPVRTEGFKTVSWLTMTET